MKYKIIEIDANQHSIVVRFYTDKITEVMLATDVLNGVVRRCRTDYNIDLPLPPPQGAALEQYILRHGPSDWLAMQEAILDPNVNTSMSAITPLLGVETHAVLAAIIPVAQSNAVVIPVELAQL